MSWKLEIWNANRSTLLNTITDAGPWGVSGGFRWQRKGTGDCVQLDLSVINRVALIGPRSVVQLTVDGTPQFFGIAPDPPNIHSPDVETVQVLGGREALRLTLMDSTAYKGQGVWSILRDIFTRLRPPSLTGLVLPAGEGPRLDLYYAPTKPLDQVLDELCKSAGMLGGVDEQGRVFAWPLAPDFVELPYEAATWRRLRVQGREACTRAVLRVLSAPNEGASSGSTYLPRPVLAVAEHSEHTIYKAEKIIETPEGMGLIREVAAQEVGGGTRVDTPENAVDGNIETAAAARVRQGTEPGFAAVTYAAVENGLRVVGARLTLQVSEQAQGAEVRLKLNEMGGNYETSEVVWTPPTGRSTLTVLAPPDTPLRTDTWAAFVTLSAYGDAAGIWTLYEVKMLTVDEEAAQNLARSYLNPPAAAPAEITLQRLQPPRREVRMTGTPDGDVSGEVGLWEYEHTPEHPRTTRIRLGSDGQSDTARAIKWAVKNGAV